MIYHRHADSVCNELIRQKYEYLKVSENYKKISTDEKESVLS